MNIALVGYGRMGQTIEGIAKERGHVISNTITIDNVSDLGKLSPENTDVAIEFTQPGAAYSNIRQLLEQGIATISGTTGWLNHMPEIRQLTQEKKGTFFYASNYSIGVNLFFKLNASLARLMKGYESEYTAQMQEVHHTEKLDAPSGTAITLAEDILENSDKLKEWVNHLPAEGHQLGIESLRQPDVPGTHTITYHSAIDDISITHHAHNRRGFALGAVMVAEWLKGKKGVLSMDDFLSNS